MSVKLIRYYFVLTLLIFVKLDNASLNRVNTNADNCFEWNSPDDVPVEWLVWQGEGRGVPSGEDTVDEEPISAMGRRVLAYFFIGFIPHKILRIQYKQTQLIIVLGDSKIEI